MKKILILLIVAFLLPLHSSIASEKQAWSKETEYWFQKYKKLLECVEEKIVGGDYSDIQIECLIMSDE